MNDNRPGTPQNPQTNLVFVGRENENNSNNAGAQNPNFNQNVGGTGQNVFNIFNYQGGVVNIYVGENGVSVEPATEPQQNVTPANQNSKSGFWGAFSGAVTGVVLTGVLLWGASQKGCPTTSNDNQTDQPVAGATPTPGSTPTGTSTDPVEQLKEIVNGKSFLFPSGKGDISDISPEDRKTLEQIAETINRIPLERNVCLKVIGGASKPGSEQKNEYLGGNRSGSVGNELTTKFFVFSGRIATESFGEKFAKDNPEYADRNVTFEVVDFPCYALAR